MEDWIFSSCRHRGLPVLAIRTPQLDGNPTDEMLSPMSFSFQNICGDVKSPIARYKPALYSVHEGINRMNIAQNYWSATESFVLESELIDEIFKFVAVYFPVTDFGCKRTRGAVA